MSVADKLFCVYTHVRLQIRFIEIFLSL